MNKGLSLIIGRAAGKEVVTVGAGAHGRFKGGRLPQRQRIDRLDIVVTINQDSRLVRTGMQPIRVDQGMPRGLDDLHMFQPALLHIGDQPLGSLHHVGLVGRNRTDAGDAQPLGQFSQLPRLGPGEE